MNAMQAETLEKIVGGEAWDSGGGIWLVTVNRDDGKLVVFSGDAVCEYDSEEDFENCRAAKQIITCEDQRFWVIMDSEGNVIYRDADLQVGWRHEEDAWREAQGLQSRESGRFFVREQ